jgi:hypothetical protein
VPTDELTVTVTTLAPLLLLHPLSQRQAMVTATAAHFQMLLDFITAASPSTSAGYPIILRPHSF